MTKESKAKYEAWLNNSNSNKDKIESTEEANRYLYQLIEDEYVLNHENDGEKFWYEIPQIKKEYDDFRRYLRRLSVSTRRKALLNMASTGMTWEDIKNCFGINAPQLNNFIKNEAKRGYDYRLLANLALLCRVPLSWLMNEEPDDEWDIGYIALIPDRVNTINELISLLQGQRNEYHVVRCAVLNDLQFSLKLRVETQPEGFIVELLNPEISGREFKLLRQILEQFNCKYGYMETVIPGRVNATFYTGTVELPIEFLT